MRRLIFGLVLVMSWDATAAMPSKLVDYARSVRLDVLELLAKDPRYQFKFERAFEMYRMDPTRIRSAGELRDAILPTHLHYVPLCMENCDAVASFAFDAKTGKPTFVSAGHAVLWKKTESARKAVPADAVLVEFPDAHEHYFWKGNRLYPLSDPTRAMDLERLRALEDELHEHREHDGGAPTTDAVAEPLESQASVVSNFEALPVPKPSEPPPPAHASTEIAPKSHSLAWLMLGALVLVLGIGASVAIRNVLLVRPSCSK